MNDKEFIDELKAIRYAVDKLIKEANFITIFDDSDEQAERDMLDIFSDEIIEKWNDGIGAKCKATKEVKSNLRARTKTFSDNEIRSAINNRINHVRNKPEWYDQQSQRPNKVNIGLVIRNDKDLDKWLNSGDGQLEMFSIKEMTIKKEEVGNKDILN